jgi:hypothetical protein
MLVQEQHMGKIVDRKNLFISASISEVSIQVDGLIKYTNTLDLSADSLHKISCL